MKNYLLLCISILSMISLTSFAQITYVNLNQKKIGGVATNNLVQTEKNYNSGKKVKYYHVEEIVNMEFGGYATTYDVSDPTLISTYNLGPNNIRIITPMYDEKEHLNELNLKATTVKSIKNPSDFVISESPTNTENVAYVDIIKTYERMSEKGYKSVDMLKKMSNAYYFNEELDKAAESYADLFKMTTDLEPEYYYRYSLSLKSIGENNKANEMLGIFNELANNTIR